MIALIISGITITFLILAIIFKPSITVKGFTIQTFWVVSLLGAMFLLIFRAVTFAEIANLFTQNSSVNPIKILILFISISILSISLDEMGFFRMCAEKALLISKKSTLSIFIILYFTTSVLTVFTSNDIIILTFTPFIIYFCKNAKINPIPLLTMEFTAANTWSNLFIIGNPTNIYLASYYNVSFFEYFKVMALPTIGIGIVSFLLLLLIFRKELKKPIDKSVLVESTKIESKPLMIISLIHLTLCTVMLVVSSYIKIEMYLICLAFAGSLTLVLAAMTVIKKKKYLKNVYKRAPWSLIPFLISMFIIVYSLNASGFITQLAKVVSVENYSLQIILMGLLSTFSANLINNIPMSICFASIIEKIPLNHLYGSLYATIIGSNVGALLTPIGALAGIMWMSLLKKNDVDYSFIDFMKNGVIIALSACLTGTLLLILVI